MIAVMCLFFRYPNMLLTELSKIKRKIIDIRCRLVYTKGS